MQDMTLYTPTSNWLGTTTAGDSLFIPLGSEPDTSACVNWFYQPWTYTYKPEITLTLAEANHLRKVARGDAKLRKTLRKFLPYIAVTPEL